MASGNSTVSNIVRCAYKLGDGLTESNRQIETNHRCDVVRSVRFDLPRLQFASTPISTLKARSRLFHFSCWKLSAGDRVLSAGSTADADAVVSAFAVVRYHIVR